MLGHLRPYIGWMKRILAWPYLKIGFSPTTVSALGVCLACVASFLFRYECYSAAFWTALWAFSTDMADGEVARMTKTTSPRGNYLDAIGDRTKEGVILLGLLPMAPNLVCLALLGTCLTSFAKARCGLVLVLDNRDWPGFGDHSDRAVLVLCAYFFAPNSILALALLVVSTWSCFVVRAQAALRMIEGAETQDLLPYLRDSRTYQR